MNKIILKGCIRNISYSHNIGDIEFYKAELLITPFGISNVSSRESVVNLKFKRFSNPYENDDYVELVGNVRTYSQKFEDKSKVDVYVFTYFDKPDDAMNTNNYTELDGRICKKGALRKTQSGKDVIDFIVANNLKSESQSLNCYIPCVAWGKNAKLIANKDIGSSVYISGKLQSREYKKKISEDDFEVRVAHEINVVSIEE